VRQFLAKKELLRRKRLRAALLAQKVPARFHSRVCVCVCVFVVVMLT
jgi:hypothetical protein